MLHNNIIKNKYNRVLLYIVLLNTDNWNWQIAVVPEKQNLGHDVTGK